ncbi:SMC family ATPase [Microbacterium sp. BG28]|uniref:SMC family ATPase n=1 Tax=Microbacterium sp. BG28 TaxID=3097356 RepID=UPI002A59CBC8|nr:SMC family ATPase [Microbacterium sp. BG28]MDY0827864.1 SMC family ATPase [Microbacterium sp. BG28]
MRLHRLELAGFGPFRDRQIVDFDAFADDGIFLITGRTGAGKSSVLDGVAFALYGNVPRYDGPDKRLRSDHASPDDPTEVSLEFTVGDVRWRVVRSPEYARPKLRGGGMTTEPARAELFELVDEAWIGRASRPRDVAEILDRVLGLNLQQFQQVILLAQNKFSRFLLARNDERQALLRTLFGTRRYEDYARDLDDRRRETQQKLSERGVHAEALLTEAELLIDDEAELPASDDLAARREAVRTAAERARYRVETTEIARAKADEAWTAAAADLALRERQLQAQRARDEADARLAALESEADSVAQARLERDRAVAAEALRGAIERAARTGVAARAAETEAAAADEEWLAAGEDPDADLDAAEEELTGELARVDAAAENERQLETLDAELALANGALADAGEALRRLTADTAEVPARREALLASRAEVAVQAARIAEGESAVEAARLRQEAGRRASDADARLTAAEAAYTAALDASAAASAALARLMRRRVAERAGELAAALVPGEPCAVCGSTEHPHPAPRAHDAVTDETIAEAEAAVVRARAEETRAAEEARGLRDELTDARSVAGGADAEALDRALGDAQEALQRARDAEARLDGIERDLALIDTQQVELAAAVESATVDEREAATRVTALAARREEIAQTVERAREEFESVADRRAALIARRERTRRRRSARAALGIAQEAADVAVAEVAEGAERAGFADPLDAADALRSRTDTAALVDRVQTHERDLALVRARLLELQLELAGVPEGPVEVGLARQKADEADRARGHAIAELSRAQSTADRLSDLVVRIDDAYASVAELAHETAVVTRLADTLLGRAPNTRRMTLETFVLAAELEEIVIAANVRLAEMSAGRYTLHHSDALAARGAASGLGIAVMDAFTGQLRPPQSLSGGETFLASLSLALGLAEVVTARAGGMRLDTLFIDEGFGSLDAETLELAMSVLDELRAGGRTVGVISHVEAMKDQLPAQLTIEATPQGPSFIRQR